MPDSDPKEDKVTSAMPTLPPGTSVGSQGELRLRGIAIAFQTPVILHTDKDSIESDAEKGVDYLVQLLKTENFWVLWH